MNREKRGTKKNVYECEKDRTETDRRTDRLGENKKKKENEREVEEGRERERYSYGARQTERERERERERGEKKGREREKRDRRRGRQSWSVHSVHCKPQNTAFSSPCFYLAIP